MDNSNSKSLSLGTQASTEISTALQNVSALAATNEQIYEVPLEEHTAGSLAVSVVAFVNAASLDSAQKVISAISLATELHSPDIRYGEKGGLKAYIVHPLRNTLRLIRLGVSDIPLLMASVLHDTVEDHPFELAAKAHVTTKDETTARDSALSFLANTYGTETAKIVEGMSNPIIADKGMTREQFVEVYLDHIRTATKDPKVFTCKVSDLIDNAVGLIHEENMKPERLLRMARKYYPAIEIMLARLEQGETEGDMLLSPAGIKSVRSQLQLGHGRLRTVLQQGDTI